MLTTTQGARVKFKNTAGVKKKMINFYWQGALIGDDANEKMVIFIIPESQFVLGYPNKNSKTYNKHRRFCTLYNKSDIKNFLTHQMNSESNSRWIRKRRRNV